MFPKIAAMVAIAFFMLAILAMVLGDPDNLDLLAIGSIWFLIAMVEN